MSCHLPPPLPPPSSATAATLSPAAHRILHSLNTTTSPSHLPPLLSHIIHHSLHLSSTTLSSAFISACSRLRRLPLALLLFSSLPRPHVFVSNSLLRALSPHPSLLLPTFSHLHRLSLPPNRFTLPLVLKPLSRLRHLPHGLSLHAFALKLGLSADLYVQNSLLSFYSACGQLPMCLRVFDEMPHKEVVAWTTVIMAFRSNNRPDEALIAFERMHFAGVRPNRVTMVNALATCAAHGALEMGVWIHEYVERSDWKLDVILGTSLVDMYGKCGRIDEALRVFSSMGEKNVYTWNSLIGGLALAKSGEEAVRWFTVMEHEGMRPDSVTLIGVLRACSHSGLVAVGRRIFKSMVGGKYGFFPGIKHYGCMVDLLGRAGCLDAALDCIERMPYEPNIVIWGSLLGGCKSHGDSALSELAAKSMVELEPWNVGHYVVLSNLYAEKGWWREAEEVRKMVKERGLRKDAGWSFTEEGVYEELAVGA